MSNEANVRMHALHLALRCAVVSSGNASTIGHVGHSLEIVYVSHIALIPVLHQSTFLYERGLARVGVSRDCKTVLCSFVKESELVEHFACMLAYVFWSAPMRARLPNIGHAHKDS